MSLGWPFWILRFHRLFIIFQRILTHNNGTALPIRWTTNPYVGIVTLLVGPRYMLIFRGDKSLMDGSVKSYWDGHFGSGLAMALSFIIFQRILTYSYTMSQPHCPDGPQIFGLLAL